MDYGNVFNYYKGPSNKDIISNKQVENNVKKALINVLQHSDPLLTAIFVSKIFSEKPQNNVYRYYYELGGKLNKVTPSAFVVGIAETKELSDPAIEKKNKTRPDAAIVCDGSLSILFEMKVRQDKLNLPQLKGHEDSFADGQHVSDYEIVTWYEIVEFFKKQKANFSRNQITLFLIDQFIQFCGNNTIGYLDKSNDYFYSFLRTEKARIIAKVIDEYLYNFSTYCHEVRDAHKFKNKNRTDCIAYMSINDPRKEKFATFTLTRDICFTLHLGKRKPQNIQRAFDIQRELNHLLEYEFITPNPTLGEAYIRLEEVKSFEQIKPFIDEVSKLRLIK
jgi:hypothetical protein